MRYFRNGEEEEYVTNCTSQASSSDECAAPELTPKDLSRITLFIGGKLAAHELTLDQMRAISKLTEISDATMGSVLYEMLGGDRAASSSPCSSLSRRLNTVEDILPVVRHCWQRGSGDLVRQAATLVKWVENYSHALQTILGSLNCLYNRAHKPHNGLYQACIDGLMEAARGDTATLKMLTDAAIGRQHLASIDTILALYYRNCVAARWDVLKDSRKQVDYLLKECNPAPGPVSNPHAILTRVGEENVRAACAKLAKFTTPELLTIAYDQNEHSLVRSNAQKELLAEHRFNEIQDLADI